MSGSRDDLPANYIQQVLTYDPDTGVLIWNIRHDMSASWNRRFAGKPAGTSRADDHIYIGLQGRRYMAHRLAWVIMTGEWPSHDVDHRNLIKSDNRRCNLRQSTRSQNCMNKGTQSNNKSGYKGVCFCTVTQRWVAQVYVNRKRFVAGRADTPEAAYELYKASAARLHGKFFNAGSGT